MSDRLAHLHLKGDRRSHRSNGDIGGNEMTVDEDHAALAAVAEGDAALCTIVGIDGSFSRRLGAQLAVRRDKTMVGSLSDGCLEHQLASDIANCVQAEVRRYGRGSKVIDFRLPCGGGLDILLDPAPDRQACAEAVAALRQRRPASLALAPNPYLHERRYIPPLRIRAFGEDPELATFARIAEAAGISCGSFGKSALAIARRPDLPHPDRWTATVLLYHDHEWETAILEHALRGESFYIGAQGGETARAQRIARLAEVGLSQEQIARVRSPVGVIPSSRTPRTLALSILSEIVAGYESLHPDG